MEDEAEVACSMLLALLNLIRGKELRVGWGLKTCFSLDVGVGR